MPTRLHVNIPVLHPTRRKARLRVGALFWLNLCLDNGLVSILTSQTKVFFYWFILVFLCILAIQFF